jgi:crotonobetainyl-CoA:carnitine CoA-transferase CaiB-like acyl-CoA transferase
VSGFGSKGSAATRPGLDIAAQAESGLMSVTGEAGRDPQRVGSPIIDQTATYVVAQMILAALFARERTGVGAYLDMALIDVAIHLQSTNLMEHVVGSQPMTRKGNGQPNLAPAADLVRTADGEIVLTAYTEPHFRRLCEVIGHPDMADDERFGSNPARVAHRDELLHAISEYFSSMTTAAALRTLQQAGLVGAAVRTYDDVLAAADVAERGTFVSAWTGHGEAFRVPALLPGGDLIDPTRQSGRIPFVDEHGDEIRRELAFVHREDVANSHGSS